MVSWIPDVSEHPGKEENAAYRGKPGLPLVQQCINSLPEKMPQADRRKSAKEIDINRR